MNDFSVTQTAFSGYRLLVAKPVTALIWFVFLLLAALAVLAITVNMAGPQLAALMAMRGQGAANPPDPTTAMTLTRQLMPFYGVSIVLAVLQSAITLGAVTRAVLRPQDSALGYLRLGADEFRLMLVALVIFVIAILCYLAIVILGSIALVSVGGVGAIRALTTGALGAVPASAILAGIAGALPGLLLLTFLLVKLSLAPAQTVAQRAIRIFESWTLTKGRFWKIFATLLLAILPIIVLQIVIAAVLGTGQRDMTTMEAAFSGHNILLTVIRAAAGVVSIAAVTVPFAVIYQAVAPSDEVSVFGDDDDDDDDDEYED